MNLEKNTESFSSYFGDYLGGPVDRALDDRHILTLFQGARVQGGSKDFSLAVKRLVSSTRYSYGQFSFSLYREKCVEKNEVRDLERIFPSPNDLH